MPALSELDVYCDMDQVLVNFLGGARRALGREFNDPALGSLESRWSALRQVEKFWLNLHWMPNASVLWSYLQEEAKSSSILSAAPPNDDAPACKPEKIEWCGIQLGLSEDRVKVVKREEKKLFALSEDGRPNLLIDDHPRNVVEWREAGGLAIHHTSVYETLQVLKHL